MLPSLRRVQQASNDGFYAAGFVAYEAAPAFDAAMETRQPSKCGLPLVWFGIYTAPIPMDDPGSSTNAPPTADWTSARTEVEFRQDIESVRQSIAAGDVYQVNLTQRLHAAFAGDTRDWYRRLRAAQRGSYSAYMDLGRFHILSLSPELFFRTEPDALAAHCAPGARTIVTRPMKGTHELSAIRARTARIRLRSVATVPH